MFDIPVNPWNADYWAGASSSGSGVATAAGLCFASLGTDTGGSIRYPSMANGIVGLKPTLGLLSRDGIIPLALSFDTAGPMARHVYGVAVALGVAARRIHRTGGSASPRRACCACCVLCLGRCAPCGTSWRSHRNVSPHARLFQHCSLQSLPFSRHQLRRNVTGACLPAVTQCNGSPFRRQR